MAFLYSIFLVNGFADEKPPASEKAAGAPSTKTDEDAIRKIINQASEAWNRKDAKAFADLYSDDADTVNSRGVRTTGRKQLEEFLAGRFASEAFRHSQHERTSIAVRFLAPTCAIVDSTWEVIGVRDAKGTAAPTRKGNSTMILMKQAGGWKIAATRSMVPAPE